MRYYIQELVIIILLLGKSFNLFAEKNLTITMHIEHAGTLGKLMCEQIASSKQHQITNLILSGEINGDDICYIRGLAGGPSSYSERYECFFGYGSGSLSDLDISEVDIVEGGSQYYYTEDEYGGFKNKRFTENNIITDEMFYHCEHLSSIKLPKSIKEIRGWAFKDTKITKLTIPENVTIIDNHYAFDGCDSLTYISVTEGNMNYMDSDGVLFNANKTELIRYPQNKNGAYVIDNDVYTIGDDAFRDCKKLTTLILPKNLRKIGYSVFYGCKGLKELYVQNSTPIDIYFGGFGINFNKCILYVPKGSFDKYYLAPGWGDFDNIKEYEGNPTGNESVKPKALSISNTINGIIINSNHIVPISIYTINGKLVNHELISGHKQISLQKGIYIVVADNNYSQKIFIK